MNKSNDNNDYQTSNSSPENEPVDKLNKITSFINKDTSTTSSDPLNLRMPRKRNFRQRAHANPYSDHDLKVPKNPSSVDWVEYYPQFNVDEHRDLKVDFLDVGCGYGGLLIKLSTLFPKKLILGLEIRNKIIQYVEYRIKALMSHTQNKNYTNIAILRTNAMKFMPNYFVRYQFEKMFFLYPDPHFKAKKHKARIITYASLSEYAYFLKPQARVYIATDVLDLFEYMVQTISRHPLFLRLEDEIAKNDCVYSLLFSATEESMKVDRESRDKHAAVFLKIEE